MKAITFCEHGGDLEYSDLPAPELTPAEVLVQLETVLHNRVELFTWEGWPRQLLPRVRHP